MKWFGTTALGMIICITMIILKLKGGIVILSWGDTFWALVYIINITLVVDLAVYILVKRKEKNGKDRSPSA